MPACTRGVTFPVGEVIQSILADGLIPPVGDIGRSYSFFESNPASKKTQGLLRILIDRFDEQLQACGVSDAGDEKSADIWGIRYNIKSEISMREAGNGYLRSKRILNDYDHTFSFTIIETGIGPQRVRACDLELDANMYPMGWGSFKLGFDVRSEMNSLSIMELSATDARAVLECFDPLGTGYEFFTPDQARRFADPIDTNRDARYLFPEDLTLTSPEIRQYMSTPNLFDRLTREFEREQYPHQTRAYRAVKPTFRRSTESSSKRRRLRWAIGASGYEISDNHVPL